MKSDSKSVNYAKTQICKTQNATQRPPKSAILQPHGSAALTLSSQIAIAEQLNLWFTKSLTPFCLTINYFFGVTSDRQGNSPYYKLHLDTNHASLQY
jgi:hypothetical protein